jgi:prepilin-type processing-associated H-X9-DG protein
LLELTVAIGIVAIAGVYLLGIVRQVQRAGNDATCQSNLAQLGDALLAYCVDNNGSYPYGWYFDPHEPFNWGAASGNARIISWPALISEYLAPGKPTLAPQFRCPDAQAQAPAHRNSYVMNFVVAISPYDERNLAPYPSPTAQLKPSRVTLALREGTALLWDTAIPGGLAPDDLGYLTGADVDGQRFWRGAQSPQWRYFDVNDPYGSLPPGQFSNNRPVGMGSNWKNIDPPIPGFPYQGNLRYRHDDQTKCNVLFSDGSVRQFTAVIRPDLSLQSHDALRRFFMTEWPPNTPRNPSVP